MAAEPDEARADAPHRAQRPAGRRGAIEVRDLGELVLLSEAVSVVSRGGFRSLAAMDAAAAMMRDMPNREATVARIERARAFCAERGILPERAASQRQRRDERGGR